MEINVLGIDLAKTVFQLHGVDKHGKVSLKKKLSRRELLPFLTNIPPCLIGMEACSGAFYWSRRFTELGHEVRLIAPQFVKPYVKTNKNDAADAEAICEAVTRPNMRFVPTKKQEHQDLQNLHRVRERLIKNRTALINEILALLHEYGIVLPGKKRALGNGFLAVLEENKENLGALTYEVFLNLWNELQGIKETLKFYEQKLAQIFKSHPVCQRLAEVPGVGELTATAILASVPDATIFKNGRALAAWVGLVPRQHSSGGKDLLLGISKRGDSYLRKNLIHGARALVRWLDRKTDPRSEWFKKLIERRGMNRAVVAMANKNARAIWVILAREEKYQPLAA